MTTIITTYEAEQQGMRDAFKSIRTNKTVYNPPLDPDLRLSYDTGYSRGLD